MEVSVVSLDLTVEEVKAMGESAWPGVGGMKGEKNVFLFNRHLYRAKSV